MMFLRALMLSTLFVQQGDPAHHARELVEKLHSDNIEDREEAAHKLKALGNEALPALRPLTSNRDPELRLRAAEIIASIQWDLAEGNLDQLLKARGETRASWKRIAHPLIDKWFPHQRFYARSNREEEASNLTRRVASVRHDGAVVELGELRMFETSENKKASAEDQLVELGAGIHARSEVEGREVSLAIGWIVRWLVPGDEPELPIRFINCDVLAKIAVVRVFFDARLWVHFTENGQILNLEFRHK
jgi:hypothetical protein